MRKTLKALSITAATLIALAIGLMQLYLPAHIQNSAQQIMLTLGLEATSLPAPQIGFGTITYKNIILDPDLLSTVEEINLHYDPLSFLLFGKISKLEVIGLNFTGEYIDGAADIAGWKMPETLSILNQINTRKIVIKKARLALLTEKLGGLNLNYSFYAKQKANGRFSYQGKLQSLQPALSFTASSQGVITPDFWNASIEIERAKFTLQSLNSKIMRMNGQLTLLQDHIQPLEIHAQLEAGGLRLLDTPWKDVKITIDGNIHTPDLFIAAQSLGEGETEINLSIQNRILSAQIYNDHAKNLLFYLEPLTHIKLPEDLYNSLQSHRNMPASFEITQNTNKLTTYKLTQNNNEISKDLYGHFSIKGDEVILSQPLTP